MSSSWSHIPSNTSLYHVPQPHLDLASPFYLNFIFISHAGAYGATAHGKGAKPIKPLMHRHYYGLVLVAVGSMASPYVCLVGWAGSLLHRRSALVVTPLRTFVCSTQATPGVSDPARPRVWIFDDCSRNSRRANCLGGSLWESFRAWQLTISHQNISLVKTCLCLCICLAVKDIMGPELPGAWLRKKLYLHVRYTV